MSDQTCVVEQILDAPADLVWQMWTNSDHFKQWYGPKGFSIPVAHLDVRVGGKRHVCMEMPSPNGPKQMWSIGEHLEIIPNQRLIYTESPSDADGNVIDPAAMGMPGFPAVTQVTIVLEAIGNQTKMTLTHVGVPAQASNGWGQAFSKMVDYIATM